MLRRRAVLTGTMALLGLGCVLIVVLRVAFPDLGAEYRSASEWTLEDFILAQLDGVWSAESADEVTIIVFRNDVAYCGRVVDGQELHSRLIPAAVSLAGTIVIKFGPYSEHRGQITGVLDTSTYNTLTLESVSPPNPDWPVFPIILSKGASIPPDSAALHSLLIAVEARIR